MEEISLAASVWDKVAVGLSAATLLFFSWILWYTRKSANETKRANDRVEQPKLAIVRAMPKVVFNEFGEVVQRAGGDETLTLPANLGPNARLLLEIRVINYGGFPASSVGVAMGYSTDRSGLEAQLVAQGKCRSRL